MKYKLIAEKPSNRTLIEQVLINRGLDPNEINHYLSANENDLYDPLLLDNMDRGAKMYIKHIVANDPMTMIVDPDVDGMTSAALFINYTYKLFPAYVQNNITYLCHTGKQHGLNDMMEWLPETKFLVMIDSSSNDYTYHKILADKGIDILVLDHHEAEKVSEYACVINNQLCDYPNKALSGVGIAYKFCCYLDQKLGIYNAHDLEDLVSIGCIADMMDVRQIETRYLITNGLKDIHNPLIKTMAERQSHQFEGSGITPMGAAFYIAPFINAVMRSGTLEEKFLLFESLLEHKAYEEIPSTKRGCKGQMETRVEQAARMASNVKNRQKRLQDSGVSAIELMIQKEHLLDNKILIVRIRDDILDKNLAGLVANQLAGKYQRPVMILRETSYEGKKCWSGSMRGYEKSELKDFRQFLLSTGLMIFVEGHANAAGCGVYDENFYALVQKTNEMLADVDFSPVYQVDAIIDYSRLTDSLVFEIANWAELWGQNLDEPLIAIENVIADDDTFSLIGQNQKTMRITVPEQKTNFIKFNLKDEEKDELLNYENLNMNIVGKFVLNYYMGTVSPQIQIVDYEIKKQLKWDF